MSNVVVSTSDAQRGAFWKIGEGISQAQMRAGKAVKHDIALPISAVAQFCSRAETAVQGVLPDAHIVNFGHLGDGNLHYNVLLPLDIDASALARVTSDLNRCVHDLVTEMNGSISAEHGVGQLRREELHHYKSAVELDLMMSIKRVLDPNQIMNPGKLL